MTVLLLLLFSFENQSALTSSRGQNNTNDTSTLKEQLSVVIKAQLDFQQKVESQISMLQTMMQTVCQLVNNELASNRKSTNPSAPQTTNVSSRVRRDSSDFQTVDARSNWSTQQNLLSRPSSAIPTKKTVSDDIPLIPTRLTNGKTSYMESHDLSKKISRPASAMSNNDNSSFDFQKSTLARRNNDFDPRLTMISPIDVPISYDAFESGLPKSNSATSLMRSGINSSSTMNPTTTTTTTTAAVRILFDFFFKRNRMSK